MAIRFSHETTLADAAKAAAAIGCELVPDGHGGAVIAHRPACSCPAASPTVCYAIRYPGNFLARDTNPRCACPCHQKQSAGVATPIVATAGHCETCGAWCGALFRGLCAWCRDHFHVIDR